MNEINKDVTNTKNISNKRLLIKEIAIFCKKKALGMAMILSVFYIFDLTEAMTLLQGLFAIFICDALLDKYIK